MIRRPPRSTQSRSSAASDVYKRQIEESEAARIESWVREAVQEGATVLTGGRRIGPALYAPTVLTNVAETSKVCAQEVFAPMVGLYRFEEFNDALARVNRSSYGLQAGLFTGDPVSYTHLTL